MNEKFIVDRITQLRIEKNISEYQLSYDLGFSKSYMSMISRNKNLPSLSAFLSICEYFEITPVQFFAPYLDGHMEDVLHMFLNLTEEEQKQIVDIMDAYLVRRAVDNKDTVNGARRDSFNT